MLNITRPLQRTSSVPLETRSCTARRPNRHIRPGVPHRGVALGPQCSAALVSMATTGNTGQSGQGIRRGAPEVHDAQPPLSAWATTGNTGQSGRGGGSLTNITVHPGIPKSLIDETSVVCLLLQLERQFFQCSSQRRTCKGCRPYRPHLLCPTPQATTSHQESCRLSRSAQDFLRQHQPLYHLQPDRHSLQLHRKAELDKCSARNQGRTEKRGTQYSVTLEHLALQSDQRKRCGT